MVDIRFASPDEKEEIAAFMAAAFPRAKWDMTGWRAILSGRWAAPGDPYAISVRDNGRLVGCLGLVASHRRAERQVCRVLNMTSWYLEKSLRGTGTGKAMLHLLMSDPKDTITNFTSAPGAAHAVRAAGMQVLDAERMIWWPDAGRTALPATKGADLDPARLSPKDVQVLQDHAGLDLHPVVIETPGGPCLIVLSIKQKHEDYVTYELFYCSDRALLSLHVEAIAATVLPQTQAMFSIDGRFLSSGVKPDDVALFAVPRFYAPGLMRAEQIDHLYSESVLLGLKLY